MNVGKTKMMVSGTQGEIAESKTDACGICGKRVGFNAVCCTLCTSVRACDVKLCIFMAKFTT